MNHRAKGKVTPLHTVAHEGHIGAIEALLDAGANINAVSNKETLVDTAGILPYTTITNN